MNRIDKHSRISVHAQISLASLYHFWLVVPDADFTEVSNQQTDYGFDVVCRGTYKYLKPKISTFVIFGEPKYGIFMDIEEVGQLDDFVTDEVLVALAN